MSNEKEYKFWYKPAYNLTEKEIRYAMKNTNSNAEAAAFLHISIPIWKKYAEMYFDPESGKSLYQLHKNQGAKFGKKPSIKLATMEDIFAGKHPKYNVHKLKARLIMEGILEERCAICGFEERRISDYTVPLVLTWKNGDKRDHSRENLEFVCYNHYHLYYGDMGQKAYIIVKK